MSHLGKKTRFPLCLFAWPAQSRGRFPFPFKLFFLYIGNTIRLSKTVRTRDIKSVT